MDESNTKAILSGTSPEGRNSILAWLFNGVFYMGSALVPTLLVAFIYSGLSTFGIIKIGSQVPGSSPFLISGGICVMLILIAFLFRTPIFNVLFH